MTEKPKQHIKSRKFDEPSTNSNIQQGGPHQKIYDDEGPSGDAAAPPA